MATTPTTSGTVGQSRLQVIRYIEHATRRCGVPPSVLTGEQLISARENLGFILTDLSTKGLAGWTYGKQVHAFVVGQCAYPLDSGTFAVSNALRRNATFNTGANSGDGYTSVFNSPDGVSVGSADIHLTSSGTFDFFLELSFDGIQYFYAGRQIKTWVAGDRAIIESTNTQPANYWRIRENTNAATFDAVYFLSNINEVPLGKLNKSDYSNLPDKGQLTTDPSTFWQDMQLEAPVINLWQAPSNAFRHIVVWGRRYVMDVGEFTNWLEVPMRWQDAIIFELATRVYLELPKEALAGVDPSRLQYLEDKAQQKLTEAFSGESDGSPLRLSPRLTPYTRG